MCQAQCWASGDTCGLYGGEACQAPLGQRQALVPCHLLISLRSAPEERNLVPWEPITGVWDLVPLASKHFQGGLKVKIAGRGIPEAGQRSLSCCQGNRGWARAPAASG